MTNTYKVETTHPNMESLCGVRELDVTTNKNGTRYVKGRGFGCSRDYTATSDRQAIVYACAENGCKLVKLNGKKV